MGRAIDWRFPVRVDLGGGLAPRPGHYNVDIIPEADIIFNLNQGLPPWPDNCVEVFFASHVIEHLNSIIPLMNDVYRTLRPGGLFELSTPYAGTSEWWQDPTHKRGYVEASFLYFADQSPFHKEQDEYGISARFWLERNERGAGIDAWQLLVTLRKPTGGGR